MFYGQPISHPAYPDNPTRHHCAQPCTCHVSIVFHPFYNHSKVHPDFFTHGALHTAARYATRPCIMLIGVANLPKIHPLPLLTGAKVSRAMYLLLYKGNILSLPDILQVRLQLQRPCAHYIYAAILPYSAVFATRQVKHDVVRLELGIAKGHPSRLRLL